MDDKEYYAHIRKKNNDKQSSSENQRINKDDIQTVSDHLIGVSEIASKLTKKIGLPDCGALLGLMHDFGKYSRDFQHYLWSATGILNHYDDDFVNFKELKGKIDHSSAGAQWIYNNLWRYGKKNQGNLCGQILFLCVASHHSGLIDCLNLCGEVVWKKRHDKSDEKSYYQECIQNCDALILKKAQTITGENFIREMISVIKKIYGPLPTPNENDKKHRLIPEFNLGFFTRFLFSCLIDADRLNTADFEIPENRAKRIQGKPDWNLASQRIEKKLPPFSKATGINQIRAKISEHCAKQGAQSEQGIFTFTVPTGGGKTLSSFRFAIKHAQKHDLDHIIYVIPFTSIIEQNAEVIRKTLDRPGEETWVLEHHSNLEPEKKTENTKLAEENWNSPVIFTTMVRFLETLFGKGTRDVRRLHQLANSVLIFDEIQTVPIHCVHLFCNALNFLVRHTRTTAILCTATQPLLNALRFPEKGQLEIPPQNELVGDAKEVKKLFDDLERVEIFNKCKSCGWSQSEISELALECFQSLGSCLVIVNTKRWATELYTSLSSEVEQSSVFHLSTSLCPAHRTAIFEKIRARLKNKQPVLCISTQLIEAGVDISFASVIRFMAGLDSIAQAAGRCNRNAEMVNDAGNPIKGKVYVVNPENEQLDKILPDIQIGKEKAERVFRDLKSSRKSVLSPESIELYFRYYFYERAEEMVYPLENGNSNMLSWLSNNDKNYGYTEREPGKFPLLLQSFMSAAKEFQSIKAPTQSIIVPYDKKGENVIAGLCRCDFRDTKLYFSLLKKAQVYSVNVFPNVYSKLEKEEALINIQGENIFALKKQYYSEYFGLSTELVNKQSTLVL